MSASPLHTWAFAQSRGGYVISAVRRLGTGDLKTEFRYDYGEQDSTYGEMFALLPVAMRTGELSETTKRAIFWRVVLRDHGALTSFFVSIIRSPAAASYVEQLHCHVDLGRHTSAQRLSQDTTQTHVLAEHLDRCSISRDLLLSLKDHADREHDRRAYDPAFGADFRHSMFLSLLGHLRRLHTLRITIYDPTGRSLSWLRSPVQRHYPSPFAGDQPCRHPCPNLSKLTFQAAAQHHPSHPRHPLTLWPLIDLATVAELEAETNPAGSGSPAAAAAGLPLHPFPPSSSSSATADLDPDNSDDNDHIIYRSLAFLHALPPKPALLLPTASLSTLLSFPSMASTCTISPSTRRARPARAKRRCPGPGSGSARGV